MIRTALRAGIDSLRYNTCILNIDRTEQEEGRGGNCYTAFRLDKISEEEQARLTDAGRVTAESVSGALCESSDWAYLPYTAT